MALPSSVSKPAIKSCRLYTVGDITSKSGVCYALSLPQIQRAVSSNRLLSILLQRFLFSHLSITYLTILLAFFPNSSLQQNYSFCSVGWFDNSACTALPIPRPLFRRLYHLQYSLFEMITSQTSWYKDFAVGLAIKVKNTIKTRVIESYR